MKTRPEYTSADYKNSIQHLGKKRENTVLPCQYKLLLKKNKKRSIIHFHYYSFFNFCHSCRKSVHKSINVNTNFLGVNKPQSLYLTN